MLGDGELLAAVAWGMTSFGQTVVGVFDASVVAIAEEALRHLGSQPSAARAQVLAVLAAEYGGSVAHAERRHGLVQEALAVARQIDDPLTLGQVLVVFQWAGWTPDNVETRLAVADELISIGDQLRQPVFAGFGHAGRSWTRFELGDIRAGLDAGAAYEAVVGDTQMALHALGLAVYRTTRLYLGGELEAAERSAEAHLELAAAAGLQPLDYYGPHIITIRFAQDRLAEIVDLVEAAAAANTDAVAYQAVVAVTQARTGGLERAAAILSMFINDGLARLPRDFFWYSGMVSLAEVAEQIGDVDAAEALAAELEPYSGRLAVYGIGATHPVDLALAQLALTGGDHAGAEALASAAVQASRQNETPIFLARALIQQAAARSGLGAHTSKIRPLVDEALAIADRTGAALVAADAERYHLV